jgi:uncharacterized membrane protein
VCVNDKQLFMRTCSSYFFYYSKKTNLLGSNLPPRLMNVLVRLSLPFARSRKEKKAINSTGETYHHTYTHNAHRYYYNKSIIIIITCWHENSTAGKSQFPLSSSSSFVETIYAFLVVYTFLVVLDRRRMRFPDLLRNTLHRWFNQTHPYLHANILL